MTNRVVITGMGGISSIGMSVPEIYNSMKEGKSGIGMLEFPDVTRLKVKTGGQIKNFDPSKHFELKQVSRMDRFSQFALLAAKEAVTSSGLENCMEDWSENAGIILGSSIGGIETINDSYKQVFENGHNRLHPLTIPKIMNNSATSLISIEYNIQNIFLHEQIMSTRIDHNDIHRHLNNTSILKQCNNL